MLEQHPLLVGSYSGLSLLPVQALPKKEKLKNKDKKGYSEWEKQNLDALEHIAYQQHIANEKFHTNEKIANGEFIVEDYYDCDDEEGQFVDTLEMLIKDGRVPKFIKNYDIVQKVINVMVSIFEEFPDIFHIVGSGEIFQSEKDRVQTELLTKWFQESLEKKIGLILEPQQEGESDEEFQKRGDELRQALTPADIGDYMKSFRHEYEMWAEYKAIDLKNKHDFQKLRKTEYRDFLINGIRARHFRVSHNGLTINTVNPRNLFYDKSSDVEYIQDGDYCGTMHKLTGQRVIDLYAKDLSSEDIQKINEVYTNFNSGEETEQTKDLFGNRINYLPINNVPYNTNLPFRNEHLNRIAPALGMNRTTYNPFDLSDSSISIFSTDFIVTEAYWKTQEKVYTLHWINPETQLQEIIEVDEEFVFPSYIKKVKNTNALAEIKFNTAVESWDTVIYGGTKIRFPNDTYRYIRTGVLEYQRSSPSQIIPQLPIFGQISTFRNVQVRGIVDRLKPYLFLHNVAMNKAAKYQERGYLPFIAMDMKIMPRHKDWGAEDEALSKWMGIGESDGIAPVDTSVANTQGDPNNGGQFPRIIDIDLTPRIIQQFQIAENIRRIAYEEIGITPQLLGAIKQTETATGVNAGINQSQYAISKWTSDFLDCEKSMLTYVLGVAQWMEAENKEVSVEYVNSDYTSGILKFANNNFNLFDWRIYVVNSQEELRRKKTFEALAMTNTLEMKVSDRLELTNASTPSERIIHLIKTSERQAEERQQQQVELEKQKNEAITAAQKQEAADRLYELKLKLASEERQAWARRFVAAGESDLNNNAIPDTFEYDKFVAQSQNELQKLGLAQDAHQFAREKEGNRKEEKNAELNLKQQELKLKEKQIAQTAKNVKVLDKGKYNGK